MATQQDSNLNHDLSGNKEASRTLRPRAWSEERFLDRVGGATPHHGFGNPSRRMQSFLPGWWFHEAPANGSSSGLPIRGSQRRL